MLQFGAVPFLLMAEECAESQVRVSWTSQCFSQRCGALVCLAGKQRGAAGFHFGASSSSVLAEQRC